MNSELIANKIYYRQQHQKHKVKRNEARRKYYREHKEEETLTRIIKVVKGKIEAYQRTLVVLLSEHRSVQERKKALRTTNI